MEVSPEASYYLLIVSMWESACSTEPRCAEIDAGEVYSAQSMWMSILPLISTAGENTPSAVINRPSAVLPTRTFPK